MIDIRYISTKEAAGIMGLSTRRVVGLCNAGNGAILSLAVGNTSYMDVVKNSYYVDKTLLMRNTANTLDLPWMK